jgi:hypothetical protein
MALIAGLSPRSTATRTALTKAPASAHVGQGLDGAAWRTFLMERRAGTVARPPAGRWFWRRRGPLTSTIRPSFRRARHGGRSRWRQKDCMTKPAKSPEKKKALRGWPAFARRRRRAGTPVGRHRGWWRCRLLRRLRFHRRQRPVVPAGPASLADLLDPRHERFQRARRRHPQCQARAGPGHRHHLQDRARGCQRPGFRSAGRRAGCDRPTRSAGNGGRN